MIGKMQLFRHKGLTEIYFHEGGVIIAVGRFRSIKNLYFYVEEAWIAHNFSPEMREAWKRARDSAFQRLNKSLLNATRK